MTDKACKDCKRVIEKGDVCPNCGGTNLTTSWKGSVTIFNENDSEIAKKMGITKPGKYALRLSK
jgi:DNA-directed RNA polymerase subunit E"